MHILVVDYSAVSSYRTPSSRLRASAHSRALVRSNDMLNSSELWRSGSALASNGWNLSKSETCEARGADFQDNGVMGWRAGEEKIRATWMSEVFWS
jgi:hypothetical protein